MSNEVGKFFRKLHRWFAVPITLAILAMLIFKLVETTPSRTSQLLERVPSILMLLMALTGIYLFLLPYIAKANRRKRLAAAQKAKGAETAQTQVR